MENVSILDFLKEMQSFVTVSKKTLEKAAESGITTENNTQLRGYLREWKDGMWDEDPSLLTQNVANMLEGHRTFDPIDHF